MLFHYFWLLRRLLKYYQNSNQLVLYFRVFFYSLDNKRKEIQISGFLEIIEISKQPSTINISIYTNFTVKQEDHDVLMY